jgi:arylsulfatase A-like enzyme
MKLYRLFVFALLPLTLSAFAQNESLVSIFTNAPPHPAVVPRRASILVIACRGLACGDLSCYGQTNFQTPNLDRLAAEGTRFTDYRASSDDLFLAQTALLEGNNGAPAPGQTTLAARLKQAGYRTGLIGEWRLDSQPWRAGFDEFAGFFTETEADNYYSDFVWRHIDYHGHDGTNGAIQPWSGREPIHANTGGRQGSYLPDVFLGAMANFVRLNVPDAANHYRPFFLLVSLPEPHSTVPGKDVYPVPTDAPFSGEKWPPAAKNRAALLTRLDTDIGRLFDEVKSLGMTNNLAIFLTGATAPEKFADASLNFLNLPGEVRGGDSPDHLRTPMLVRWPGHVPAGRVSAAPWTTADFAPTALNIAYLPSPAAYAGHSVLPLLLGRLKAGNSLSPDAPAR